MIDPISLGLMAAGTAMQASAANQQGKMAMSTARRNKEILQVQEQQDRDATVEGMARRRIDNNRTLSSIRNRMSGSGLETTSGSSADFLAEASSRLELQILDEARQQEIRSRANKNQQDTEMHQGKVAKANAQASRNAGLIEGGVKIAGHVGELKKNYSGNNFWGEMLGRAPT